MDMMSELSNVKKKKKLSVKIQYYLNIKQKIMILEFGENLVMKTLLKLLQAQNMKDN